MPTYGQSWRKLHALFVAIEAAAMREPYPRLAQIMQNLASQQAGMQGSSSRPTYG
jgi:hypothetical protein